MGIVKKESIFPKIETATCDCCKKEIKLNMIGELPDHAMIGGYKNGLLSINLALFLRVSLLTILEYF